MPNRESQSASWVWKELGYAGCRDERRVMLPQPPFKQPGVYQLLGLGPDPWVYIGESKDVRSRFRAYRTPKPTVMPTSTDLHYVMRDWLLAGHTIRVSTMDKIQFGRIRGYGLESKLTRLWLEGSAVVYARMSGQVRVMNADGHLEREVDRGSV